MMEHRQRVARSEFDSREPPAGPRRRGCRRIGGAVEKQSLVTIGAVVGSDEVRDVIFDEARVNPIADELGMTQQALQEAKVGSYAFDLELAQRPIGLGYRIG